MNYDDFYVVAREQGAERSDIPLWANTGENPAQLALIHERQVELNPIEEVPGAFQLLNVLSQAECQRLIEVAESLSFNLDAAVSLPRSVRHNLSLTWVIDEQTESLIWERCAPLLSQGIDAISGQVPVGINARCRFYKYGEGDFFKPHIDGAWPGSKIINQQNIMNAYDDRWSQMTFLILLSDDFKGGHTQFWVNAQDDSRPAKNGEPAKIINVRTPAGGVLCFPHGTHPLHCLHSSEAITQGVKYIIRSDLLFPID